MVDLEEDMEEDDKEEQPSAAGVVGVDSMRDLMPTMSMSVDIEHLRSQWRKRKRPGGDEKGIATFQAASVKVRPVPQVLVHVGKTGILHEGIKYHQSRRRIKEGRLDGGPGSTSPPACNPLQ